MCLCRGELHANLGKINKHRLKSFYYIVSNSKEMSAEGFTSQIGDKRGAASQNWTDRRLN